MAAERLHIKPCMAKDGSTVLQIGSSKRWSGKFNTSLWLSNGCMRRSQIQKIIHLSSQNTRICQAFCFHSTSPDVDVINGDLPYLPETISRSRAVTNTRISWRTNVNVFFMGTRRLWTGSSGDSIALTVLCQRAWSIKHISKNFCSHNNNAAFCIERDISSLKSHRLVPKLLSHLCELLIG